jgi:hypothetical protein
MSRIYLISILSLYYLTCVLAISSGANEPIADNELGLTAKDCALQYCSTKDGMALWLTLVNECVSNPNPYLISKKGLEENFENNNNDAISYYLLEKVNPFIGGSVCAIMSLIGLLIGYVLGVKSEEENQYIQLKQRRKKYQIDN